MRYIERFDGNTLEQQIYKAGVEGTKGKQTDTTWLNGVSNILFEKDDHPVF